MTKPDPLAGETLIKWAYCSRWTDGSDHIMHCSNEGEARRMVAQGSPTPGIKRRLMRRVIKVSRWENVDD